jgi:hypothetical protein
LTRTYWMLCGHSRSSTGRGTGDCSGHGESSGSVNSHGPLSTIHGRVLTPTAAVGSTANSNSPLSADRADRLRGPGHALQAERTRNARSVRALCQSLRDRPPGRTAAE